MTSFIEIKEVQSERLQRLASEKGVMPDALVEEALELLFEQAEIEKGIQDEQMFLNQLLAEDDGSLQAHIRPPFQTGAVTITHSVPVKPAHLSRSVR